MQLPGIDEKQVDKADSLLRAGLEERVRTFAGMSWTERYHLILEDLLNYGVKLLIAIAIFLVGRWLIRRFVKVMNLIFEKRRVDPSLRTFIRSLCEIFFYLVLFYLIILCLGVDTSLFVALFAAAGLAIGMAMSGVFQNFAGGVMILLLKPFRDGDYIEVQGQAGTVEEIKLFNTELRTVDNKTILLPNGSVSNSIVNNYNVARTRRLEWIVALALDTDFAAVRKTMMDLMKAEPKILATPAPEVVLSKLNSGSIEVTVHAWVESADNLAVFHKMNEVIHDTLPEKGFSYPSSAMNVTLTKPSV